MTTERTLKKWRKEALIGKTLDSQLYEGTASNLATAFFRAQHRILQMTQELLDQHLLQKKD